MRHHTRRLPEELREELRRPLGELISEGIVEAAKTLMERVGSSKERLKIIAVGDQSSKALLAAGGKAHVYIFDGKSHRRRTRQPKPSVEKSVKVRNPPGMLTGEAREAVRKAVKHPGDVSIFVDGEEDLLALAAILYAPLGSLILYGQPGEGLVVVKVNRGKKDLVRNIINRMAVV